MMLSISTIAAIKIPVLIALLVLRVKKYCRRRREFAALQSGQNGTVAK